MSTLDVDVVRTYDIDNGIAWSKDPPNLHQ
ncbi:hypothetical protein CEXT_783151, partial [Caerostris extrusa]